jgi:ribonuclease HII
MNSETDLFAVERELRASGWVWIAGVDEAGRGPLAGPVVAAAAVFRADVVIPGVNDSKLLPAERREVLYEQIIRHASGVGVGVISNEVIDSVNILNATFLAMEQAVASLPLRPDMLLVDGNMFRPGGVPYRTLVGGDRCSFSIAAASIVAKVTRDRMMVEYERLYPGYGFLHNKGYPTAGHRDAVLRLGPCPIHRRSFAPIRAQHPGERGEAL